MSWRLEISATFLAPGDGDVLLHALCDIHLRAYAVDAHVGGVGSDRQSAQTTQPAAATCLRHCKADGDTKCIT